MKAKGIKMPTNESDKLPDSVEASDEQINQLTMRGGQLQYQGKIIEAQLQDVNIRLNKLLQHHNELLKKQEETKGQENVQSTDQASTTTC